MTNEPYPPDDAPKSGLSRRGFLKGAGLTTAGSLLLTGELFAAPAAVPTPLDDLDGVRLAFQVNGVPHRLLVEPRVTLLDALREQLGLTGTKKGCNHGQCGACTVLVNGERIYSCLSLACTHDGDQVTTVEGLAQGDQLHPVQQAFIDHDGFQCGYCTPGQVCSGVALLAEVKAGRLSHVTPPAVLASGAAPVLTELEIRERMSGNLCRCGAYNGIVAAIQQAAAQANLNQGQG